MTPEAPRPLEPQCSLEISQPSLDAIIVPGKTAFRGIWSGNLDPLTKLHLMAAGNLFKEGGVKNLILSAGRLEGSASPSEAQGMKNFLKKRFPDIPDNAIILAGRSKSLAGNINGVRRIIKKHGFKIVGFLSAKPTIRYSDVLLQAYMKGLKGLYIVASEQVMSRKTKDPDLFLKAFAETRAYRDEETKRLYRAGEIFPLF